MNEGQADTKAKVQDFPLLWFQSGRAFGAEEVAVK